MSTTLITLAADHVSGLLVQGLTLNKALEHAKLRFGVSRDLILAEINARHAFALTVSDSDEPFSAAGEITTADGREADLSWCNCGAKTPQGQYHAITCPARRTHV